MSIRKQRVVSGICEWWEPPKNHTTASDGGPPLASPRSQGRESQTRRAQYEPWRVAGGKRKRACERNTEITETGRGGHRGSNGAGEQKSSSLGGWFAELSKSAAPLVERAGDSCRHNHADRQWRGFQAGREYRIGPGTRRCPLEELTVGSYVAPLCCGAIPPRFVCNHPQKERPG